MSMSGFDLDHEQGRGGPRHSLASETTHVSLVGTTVRLVDDDGPHNDESSFNLFASSFDSLGEPGNLLLASSVDVFDRHPMMSPKNELNKVPSAMSSDLSPIKVDYIASPATSNPFFVLRSVDKAFEGFKYFLPCLLGEDVCRVNVSQHGKIRQYQPYRDEEEHKVAMKIARRRVGAAVCAFGGVLYMQPVLSPRSSIFRLKASSGSREAYEQQLQRRYVIGSKQVSWLNEENPPIHMDDDEKAGDADPLGNHKQPDCVPSSSNDLHATAATGDSAAEKSKAKYRCKMCDQPKQNHKCPYRSSLHRSIGVMVYPAVNSYTAAEPGSLAPALTKMNNFVSYDSDHGSPRPEYELAVASSRTLLMNQVTPEVSRGASSPRGSDYGHAPKRVKMMIKEEPCLDVGDSLFKETVALRPEHYRAISPTTDGCRKYHYQPIPLTFKERKNLSDTLFYLSRDIPTVTTDCARTLRMARECGEWDQAVAELMTQVIVCLHCVEGDSELDGLQQYLLSIGIAC